MAPAVARADPVAWEKARQRKARGLDTAEARAEYVRILADACENRHDPQACVEAATVEGNLGRTLLFHGCSLGEDAACAAYMNAEMEHDKRDRPYALADAKRALAQGCAYSGGNACITLSRWNGESSPPPKTGASSGLGYMASPELNVEELRIAQVACALGCTEELKGCTSRCSMSPGNTRDCVFGCSDSSRSCARGCSP